MNKLFLFGFLGNKTCFLNTSKEEATRRYAKMEDISLEKAESMFLEEMEFHEVFWAYDVQEKAFG
jgi:hypothetical protein